MIRHIDRLRTLACAVLALSSVGTALGGVITNSHGTFSVGIDTLGNLYDPSSGVGFARTGDGYDPISPTVPRDAYGASAGGFGGVVDPANFATFGIVANGAPVFGPGSAFVSTLLQIPGPIPLLRIDQTFGFAADNVLTIDTVLTNISGGPRSVRFARVVDFDIDPTPFHEFITDSDRAGAVKDASYSGFESADPLVPFQFSTGAGGIFGPDDLGAGVQLRLGSLASGASVGFRFFYALNVPGQSEADLRTQLYEMGANYILSGVSSDDDGTNAAALGVYSVPEPSTLMLMLAGATIAATRFGFRARTRRIAPTRGDCRRVSPRSSFGPARRGALAHWHPDA